MSDSLYNGPCEAGCKSFHGGEKRHHPDCGHYPESLTKLNADRIEKLEAKLRKAVGALGDISNGEPEWPDDPQKELDWCRNRATTILAALKGQDDE